MTHEQRMKAVIEAGEKAESDDWLRAAKLLWAAANARETFALAAEIVRAVEEFKRWEDEVNTRETKPHVLGRLEILEKLYGLLAKWEGGQDA